MVCRESTSLILYNGKAEKQTSSRLQPTPDDDGGSPFVADELRRSERDVLTRLNSLRRLQKSLRDLSASETSRSLCRRRFLTDMTSFLTTCVSHTPITPLESYLSLSVTRLLDLESQFSRLTELCERSLNGALAPLVISAQEVRERSKTLKSCSERSDSTLMRLSSVKSSQKAAYLVAEASEARRETSQATRELFGALEKSRSVARVRAMECGYEVVRAHERLFSEALDSLQSCGEESGVKEELEEEMRRLEVLQNGTELPGSVERFVGCSSSVTTPGNQADMRGYLLKSRGIKGWRKQFFVVNRAGQLMSFRQQERDPYVTLNLAEESATRVRSDVDRLNCFEVVTPQKTLLLQAETPEKMMAWLSALESAKSFATSGGGGGGAPCHKEGAQEPGPASRPMGSPRTSPRSPESPPLAQQTELLRVLWSVSPRNRLCADCNASDPDWVAINLGVLFCIKCSGVHRSLGVHVSKVRSLVLDVVESEVLLLIARLGNERVNRILEGRAQSPGCSTAIFTDEERATFIRNKYERKVLVPELVLPSGDDLNQELGDAVSMDDIPRALNLIVHGASVSSPLEDGSALIHLATRKRYLVMLTFLLINNASPEQEDSASWTALHYAADSDHLELIALLLHFGANPLHQSRDGLTPLDLALKREHVRCATVLKMAVVIRSNDSVSTITAFQDSLRCEEAAVKAELFPSGLAEEIRKQSSWRPPFQ